MLENVTFGGLQFGTDRLVTIAKTINILYYFVEYNFQGKVLKSLLRAFGLLSRVYHNESFLI
jgi:hypothetical protein